MTNFRHLGWVAVLAVMGAFLCGAPAVAKGKKAEAAVAAEPVPRAMVQLMPYGHGAEDVYAGIQWRPEFSDLRIAIGNRSKKTLTDMRVTIATDQWVAGVGMKPDLADAPEVFVLDGEARTALAAPLPEAVKAGPSLTIICPKFAGEGTIGLVLATRVPAGSRTPFVSGHVAPQWARISLSYKVGGVLQTPDDIVISLMKPVKL